MHPHPDQSVDVCFDYQLFQCQSFSSDNKMADELTTQLKTTCHNAFSSSTHQDACSSAYRHRIYRWQNNIQPLHILYTMFALLLLGAQITIGHRSVVGSSSLTSDLSFICPSHCQCETFDQKLLSANCSGSGATALPSLPPGTRLHSLWFEHNRLPVLVAKSFSAAHLQHVQRVFLSSNGIRALQPDSFYGLQQLHELDLSSNQLTALPIAALSSLNQLNTLRLNANPFQELREQDLQTLGNELLHLELAYCGLEQLPELRSLRRLQTLNLTGNRLSQLPEDLFCPLSALLTLNLTGNALVDYRSLGVVDPATGSLCLTQLQHLDMSDNQLRELPETAVASLKQLRTLNLHRNQIAVVSELALRSLRNLHSLDLSDNILSQLPNQTFRGCPELRHLSLRNNSLEWIPAELFKELAQLSFLDLSANRLVSEGLSDESFVDLTRLLELNLSSNRLRTLPLRLLQSQFKVHVLDLSNNQLERLEAQSFTWLYNLNVLRLSGNRLRSLDAQALSGLFVLSHLFLADNQLTQIHELALHNSSTLESLHVQNNLLRSLPEALGSVRSLKHLDVSGNAIVRFDNHSSSPLAQLSQLRTLLAARNQLSVLPIGSLRGLLSLESLDLSQNRLQRLDYGVFHDAPSLVKLQLQQNALKDINGQFMKLVSLQTLNASHNQISWFDYALIPEQLHTLDLSSNEIRSLSNQAGERALRLSVLRLSRNQISQLNPALLPGSLQQLDLSYNLLNQLQPLLFVHKHNLSFVDLSYNRFRSLDMAAFRLPPLLPGRSVPQFRLSGNKLVCDCQLEWLQRLARTQQAGGAASGALLALGASSAVSSSAIRQMPHVQDLAQLECELPFVKQSAIVPLLSANSSSLLCRYRSHCFALCHCCEFDACDCEMQCPDHCSCYHDSSWQTNIVDCSASGNPTAGAVISQVPARIPMDVTDLFLDGQQLHTLASHTFIGRKNMRALYLNGSHVHHISNRTFNGLALLQSLHLQHNSLSRFHGHEFEGLGSLRELRLDHNQLQFIAERTFEPLRSLQMLRLQHNRLVQLPFRQMPAQMSALQSLTLAGNQFHCQCELLHVMQPLLGRVSDLQRVQCVLHNSRNHTAAGPLLFEFLTANCAPLDSRLLQIAGEQTQIIGTQPSGPGNLLQISNSGSSSSSSSASSSLLDQLAAGAGSNNHNRLSETSPFQEYFMALRQSWPLLTALALLGFVLAILLLSGYVYRKQLGIWAYAAFGVRLFQRAGHSRYSMQSERLYDAFVSYAPHEEEFVRHKLAAELELGHPSYRLFLNYRDLPVTNYVKEAVAEVIQCSHRSILLLTPQYLSSENCLFELKMALHNSLHSDHQLILLQMDRSFNLHELYQFDDLHAALKSPNSTLIAYDDKRFWERLKYAMPVARSAQHYAYSMPSLAPYAATLPPPQHTFGSPQSSMLTLPGHAQAIHQHHALPLPLPPSQPPPPPPPPSYCKKLSGIVDFKRGLPMNV